MKRGLIALILCLACGMTVSAQDSPDMSFYLMDYTRPEGSFTDRYTILQAIVEAEYTGIGEFYHEALKYLLVRFPEVHSVRDRDVAEKSAVILCEGIGREKYDKAAADLWQVVDNFSVTVLRRTADVYEGLAGQAALIALGQTGGKEYLPQIIARLNDFNTQTYKGEQLLKVQRIVIGCVSAIEAFKDLSGYRPVFYVFVGSYDGAIQRVASAALPNISDDPSEVITQIIVDPSSTPPIKLAAWKELARTKAPGESKAKTAAAALNTGWYYSTTNKNYQTNLREMRKDAIQTIIQFGAADDSVYGNLDKSYSNNFANANPDYDEIMHTLNALGSLKTDAAVDLLYKFLFDLDVRRRRNVWGNKEMQCYRWVVNCLAITGTQNTQVRQLLTTISRLDLYTSQEKMIARDAMQKLGFIR
jgi:hypothetical protein